MESQEKKMPSKEIQIRIGENDYTVKFPTNGQLIDIEKRKVNMTDGTHRSLLLGQASAQQAYILVEAIATFSVLIPQLDTDLNVKSLMDLDPMQSKSMVNEYIKKFYPWFNEWMDIINEKIE